MISDNLITEQTTGDQESAGDSKNQGGTINQVEKTEVKSKTAMVGTEEKLLAGLSYIPFLGFVTTTFKPKSHFCSFHGNQGIALTIVFFIIVFWLLLESITGSLAFLTWFGVSVAGAVKALQGDLWEIPFLSAIAQKIDLSQIMKGAAGLLPETQEANKNQIKPVSSSNEKAEKTDTSKT